MPAVLPAGSIDVEVLPPVKAITTTMNDDDETPLTPVVSAIISPHHWLI